MKVQELLANIRNKDFNLERGLQVKKYLPIEVKKTIAQSIIYDCTDNEFGVAKMDSVQRYISYVRYMITTHTNLEYTDADYDALCSTKYGEVTLLNAIMGCFEEDAKECTRILNLVTDDVIYENSLNFSIGKLLYGIHNSLSSLTEGLNSKIEEFNLGDIASNGINTEQLAGILNLINKK